MAIPNDTQYATQWALNNSISPGADIHAQAAWDIYTGSTNNIIAIIDGGADVTHEDLSSKIAAADSGFGWNGHGIHVAGIAAAASNNGTGISGVDWNARILAKRVDNIVDDAGTYQLIIDAVNYSSNVKVLNNSWGLNHDDLIRTPGRYSSTVAAAFAYAYKANRTSVAAMGNHQQTFPGNKSYPAGFNNVIAVGATDNFDVIADFSLQDSFIDVVAPGVDIFSTLPGSTYGNDSGTSMASPHVAGLASLLKGYNNNLANDDIKNIIRLTADKVAGMSGQNFTTAYGFGRINAATALGVLQAPNSLHHFTATGGAIASSSSNYTTSLFTFSNLPTGAYVVKRHEVTKSVTFPVSFCGIIGAWGRGVGTTGYSVASPNYGEGFCEVVPGTATNTGATLRTYVYQVYNTIGQSLGYFPTTPANVTFAYTVLGQANNFTISGPSSFCTTATYSILNLPTGATVTWSVTGTYSISGSNTANPVTVQRTSNGYGVLTANITTNCNTYTVTKNLSPVTITLEAGDSGSCGGTATVAGATGTFTWTVTGDLLINGSLTTLTTTSNQISFTGTEGAIEVVGGDCSMNLSEYFAPFQPQIHFAVNPAIGGEPLSASVYPYNHSYSAIRWYLDGTLLETGTEIFYVSNPPCGNSEVKVEIDLGCGTTVTSTATFERICSWWRSMVIYPNPASSYINIQPDTEKLKSLSATEKSSMKEYEASLYDISGKLLLKGRSNGYRLNLDTRHLKSDNYFIHIKIDGEKEIIKKQVIIKN